MSDRDFLVVGLGNIGPEYACTRHNIGFMVLDAWAQASNTVFHTARYGDILEVGVKGRKFHLLKPSTYMNLSGNAVRYWMKELEIPLEHLIVVCDDLNLPFGTVRMRTSGSDGGHNGLKNINELMETTSYCRIRAGVGHEFEPGGQVDFVLGEFSVEQSLELSDIEKKIIEGIRLWAFEGSQKAMSFLNSKAKTQ